MDCDLQSECLKCSTGYFLSSNNTCLKNKENCVIHSSTVSMGDSDYKKIIQIPDDILEESIHCDKN